MVCIARHHKYVKSTQIGHELLLKVTSQSGAVLSALLRTFHDLVVDICDVHDLEQGDMESPFQNFSNYVQADIISARKFRQNNDKRHHKRYRACPT